MEKYLYGMPLNSVKWRVPSRRYPIAYSTELVRNVILALAEDCESVQMIKERMSLNRDIVRVIDAYIKLGYGDRKPGILQKWSK